jgi:IclR family acetate operon transcriptional repressor
VSADSRLTDKKARTPEAGKSQSLDRGLDVLELLDDAPAPIGIREMSRRLDLHPPIVQRLVQTLLSRGYVRQDPETRRYSIGYRVLTIGASIHRNDALIVASRRELTALTRQIRVDAYLGVQEGNEVVYLLNVQSEGPVSVRSEPGQSIYLHSTAIGKIILASRTEEEARRLLGAEPLSARTPKTITDPDHLIASLQKVRKDGFARVEDENILGISSVGAPILDASGKVCAAISVSYSRHFTPELRIRDVAELVKRAASNISASLGRVS